jgi:hypothetical protein
VGLIILSTTQATCGSRDACGCLTNKASSHQRKSPIRTERHEKRNAYSFPIHALSCVTAARTSIITTIFLVHSAHLSSQNNKGPLTCVGTRCRVFAYHLLSCLRFRPRVSENFVVCPKFTVIQPKYVLNYISFSLLLIPVSWQVSLYSSYIARG